MPSIFTSLKRRVLFSQINRKCFVGAVVIEDFVIFRVVGSIDHAMDFRSIDVIVHLILQSIGKESNDSSRYRSNVLSLSSRKNVTLL